MHWVFDCLYIQYERTGPDIYSKTGFLNDPANDGIVGINLLDSKTHFISFIKTFFFDRLGDNYSY